jgi:hypothetical protein
MPARVTQDIERRMGSPHRIAIPQLTHDKSSKALGQPPNFGQTSKAAAEPQGGGIIQPSENLVSHE